MGIDGGGWGMGDRTWAGVGVCKIETGAFMMGRRVFGEKLYCRYLLCSLWNAKPCG